MPDKLLGAPADEAPEEGPAGAAVEAGRLVAGRALVARDAARVGGALHDVLDGVAVDDEALDGAVQAAHHARLATHRVGQPAKMYSHREVQDFVQHVEFIVSHPLGLAKEWFLGCVNSRPAARGSKETGFTQPMSHCFAEP